MAGEHVLDSVVSIIIKQAVALQRTERMESMHWTLTGAHEVVINMFFHNVHRVQQKLGAQSFLCVTYSHIMIIVAQSRDFVVVACVYACVCVFCFGLWWGCFMWGGREDGIFQCVVFLSF